MKHDELAKVWKERMARDACVVTSQAVIRSGKVMELVVSICMQNFRYTLTALAI